MTWYALVRDNVVASVVDLATEDDVYAVAGQYQNVVDLTTVTPTPEVGWAFAPAGFTQPPGAAQGKTRITRLALRQRFTMVEKATLYTVAATPQGVALRVFLDDLASSTYVDLSRADTIAGINYLAAAGLITTARAAEILNPVATETEIYRG